MSEKFNNQYRIPSARWRNWNYGLSGAYFITICTSNKLHYFGQVIDQKMQLSSVGIIANLMWYEIVKHSNNITLGEFIVMPNHIHGIIIINNTVETRHALSNTQTSETNVIQSKTDIISSKTDAGLLGQNVSRETRHALSLHSRYQNQGKNTISSIVGSYKSAVSKHANRLNFQFKWQSRFHDHVIRSEKSFNNISNYIHNNPIKWSEDRFYNKY